MGNLEMTAPTLSFWQGRRVLLTGHTGFKGSWLACWLSQLQAEVYGFSLPPDTEPSLYKILNLPYADEEIEDLRISAAISAFVASVRPEIVLHLAAQPLVRRGYHDPVETFSTNIMGTVNLLQALRDIDSLRAVLVITSDKAYDNTSRNEKSNPQFFRETDPLGGCDPYSASKAAQEIVTHSFSESYFRGHDVPVATARAGNVIGGGDWSEDRLMTDVLRAVEINMPVRVRSAEATRPWQHVLEPLAGYLVYAEALVMGRVLDRALNFGPTRSHRVIEVVETVLALWPNNAGWVQETSAEPETHALELDPTRAMSALGWRSRLTLQEAVSMVVEWHKDCANNGDTCTTTLQQIARYEDVLRSP